jgi:hypothetical protein
VYQLQPVIVQQAAEEVSRREVEAPLEEGSEDDLLLDVLVGVLDRQPTKGSTRSR